MIDYLGFMQGRLSPPVNGQIQSFPWDHWKSEFPIAHKLGINIMEWTLDHDRLLDNPLLTSDGQRDIKSLSNLYNITIPSLTGDCFMQAPFWKNPDLGSNQLKQEFLQVCRACASVGIQIIVVPLVDNSRIENNQQEAELVEFFLAHLNFFKSHNLRIVFECDHSPTQLRKFINYFPSETFGVNYDIGNSASLGFSPREEFQEYGKRIVHVHVKDRLLGGTTVPLGTGNADFDLVFDLLHNIGYSGYLIMQTARANNGDHSGVLARYKSLIQVWNKTF